MRDPRFVMRVAGFGVAIGMVLLPQPAEAGERKAEVRSLRSEVGRPAVARAPAVGGNSFARQSRDYGATGGRVVFATAGPAVVTRHEAERREPVSRPEHKTITFFRFTTPKLGEVSVQPVVGGVNGAQLSIGF